MTKQTANDFPANVARVCLHIGYVRSKAFQTPLRTHK